VIRGQVRSYSRIAVKSARLKNNLARYLILKMDSANPNITSVFNGLTDVVPIDDKIYPSYKVAVLVEVLQEQGISGESVLAGTDIKTENLYSAGTRISRRQLLNAYNNAVSLSDEPGLGLKVGRRLRVSEYGMYGYALMSSRTLRDALEFAIKYHQLATPTVRMSLLHDDDDDVAIFLMEDITFDDKLIEFNLSMQFALVLSLFEDMLGENFEFQQVRCSAKEATHIDLYQQTLACDVVFGAARNELRFDEWWLSKALRRANPITAELLAKTCDDLLSEMQGAEGIVKEVAWVVTQNLEDGPSIEDVANHLNMSSRTLRRRLTEHDASYQRILQDVRCQIAIAYLRDTQMTVQDIATRVGFGDPANFRHAFKRWTGYPPSHYRALRL
jgi:AraC-like DNA-binding protein